MTGAPACRAVPTGSLGPVVRLRVSFQPCPGLRAPKGLGETVPVGVADCSALRMSGTDPLTLCNPVILPKHPLLPHGARLLPPLPLAGLSPPTSAQALRS